MGMCFVVAFKLTFWCELKPIAAPHAFLCSFLVCGMFKVTLRFGWVCFGI
jgi:hypothetical protein